MQRIGLKNREISKVEGREITGMPAQLANRVTVHGVPSAATRPSTAPTASTAVTPPDSTFNASVICYGYSFCILFLVVIR